MYKMKLILIYKINYCLMLFIVNLFEVFFIISIF